MLGRDEHETLRNWLGTGTGLTTVVPRRSEGEAKPPKCSESCVQEQTRILEMPPSPLPADGYLDPRRESHYRTHEAIGNRVPVGTPPESIGEQMAGEQEAWHSCVSRVRGCINSPAAPSLGT